MNLPSEIDHFRRDALFARTKGLVSQNLAHRKVLLVGCGSGGSYVAELLVRSGLGSISLVDPDTVEPSNLGRSQYVSADIGVAKVEALESRLKAILPTIHLTRIEKAIEDLSPEEIQVEFETADLVIAATDNNHAQLRISQLSYWHSKPAIFPGLYKGARGGEIILSIPGEPCWDCSTAGLRNGIDHSEQRSTDYGTGRLVAEPGLLADIHHVSSSAVKLALGLLDPAPESAVSQLVSAAALRRLQYVVFSMTDDYWIFPHMLRSAPGQLAFQSLWISTESRPDCATCGDLSERIDPYTFSNAPSQASRRALMESFASATPLALHDGEET